MNEELSSYEAAISSREIEDIKHKEASIKIQEDQVQHIIKLLTEEFNIDKADENSGGSEGKETGDTGDTGFDEARSDEKEEDKEEEAVSNSENTEQLSDDAGTDYVNVNEQLLVNTERDEEIQLTELNLVRHNSEGNEFQHHSRSQTATDEKEEQEATCGEAEANYYDFDDAIVNESSEIVDEAERKAYMEVVEFVVKAQDFGANALDLSKKKLKKLPRELLDLNNLQVNVFWLLVCKFCFDFYINSSELVR